MPTMNPAPAVRAAATPAGSVSKTATSLIRNGDSDLQLRTLELEDS